jgi:hypothetical protein
LRFAVWTFGLMALGCSADAVSAPEPDITTLGAFVATRHDDGHFELLRTRRVDPLPPRFEGDVTDALLHFIIYRDRASSYEDARRIAQSRMLGTVSEDTVIFQSIFVQNEHRVVWFRTLDEDER